MDVRPRILTTAIDGADGTASLELALDVAPHFGLKPGRAGAIVHDVGMAVTQRRGMAASLGLSSGEIQRMSSAFEHGDLDKAVAIP